MLHYSHSKFYKCFSVLAVGPPKSGVLLAVRTGGVIKIGSEQEGAKTLRSRHRLHNFKHY